VGVVLLAVSLYGVNPGNVRQLIVGVTPGWLVLAALLYLSAYVVRSLRWRLVLKPVQEVAPLESFRMFMAGYFLNYIIPIRAGEVAKSFFLKQLKGVPISASLPTVFVDKLLDLFSIILVVLLIPVVSGSLNKYLLTLIVTVLAVFVAGIVLLALAVAHEEATVRLLSRLFCWLPGRLHERLAGWIRLFVKGMGVVRQNVKSGGALVALTALAVLLDAVYFSTMFRAFGIGISFAKVLFGYTLIYLSYILPTPPAQIGHNEGVMVLIFAVGLGLGRDEVSAVMILAHVLTGLIITAVGLWSFTGMSMRVTDSFRHVSRARAAGGGPPERAEDGPDGARGGRA
jgi:uncharacterized protein (TIRG00374 family)